MVQHDGRITADAATGPSPFGPSPSVSPVPASVPCAARSELPKRERQLQFIGDVIQYWITWVTRQHADEGSAATPDTHVMFGYENAPPTWPSIGQLTKWLEVIRAGASGIAAGTDETPQAAQPEGQEPDPKGDAQGYRP